MRNLEDYQKELTRVKEILRANPRGMTVNNFIPGKGNLAQDTLITAEHPGEVHHLPQPDSAPPAENPPDIRQAHAGTRCLQVGRRHAGRSH